MVQPRPAEGAPERPNKKHPLPDQRKGMLRLGFFWGVLCRSAVGSQGSGAKSIFRARRISSVLQRNLYITGNRCAELGLIAI